MSGGCDKNGYSVFVEDKSITEEEFRNLYNYEDDYEKTLSWEDIKDFYIVSYEYYYDIKTKKITKEVDVYLIY